MSGIPFWGVSVAVAPQLGQRVAPAGMLAPQFLHVIPIEPIVGLDPIEPIGIDPMGWGGIAPGVIAGLKTIPKNI